MNGYVKVLFFMFGLTSVVNCAGLTDGYVRTPAIYREKDRLKIANCRAVCLDECWHVCEMLLVEYRVWSPMCSAPSICFPGCVTACSYQQNGSPKFKHQNQPVKLVSNFQLSKDEIPMMEVEWKKPDFNEGTLIYVVSRQKESDNSWVEISQTSELRIEMPKKFWNCSSQFKIMAVSAVGVIAEVYIETSNSYIDNNVQRDGGHNYQPSLHVPILWIPRLVSMEKSSKNSAIEALIAWSPTQEGHCRKYEVSWRVLDQSMEVTGHLYTFTHLASLAMWPNSLHSVDVTCINSEGKQLQRSDALFINSRDLEKNESNVQVATTVCPEYIYLIIMMAIMVTLFVLFLGAFSVWIRRVRSSQRFRRQSESYSNNIQAIMPTSGKRNASHVNAVITNEAKVIIGRHRKLVKSLTRKLSSISGPRTPTCETEVDLLDDDVFITEQADGQFVFEPKPSSLKK